MNENHAMTSEQQVALSEIRTLSKPLAHWARPAKLMRRLCGQMGSLRGQPKKWPTGCKSARRRNDYGTLA